jgi:hypothetical protein
MPKKESKQLNEATLMIALAIESGGALTTERKNVLLKEFQEKFQCSEKTAYYYYFYKAQKALKADGVEVMAVKSKTTKRVKTAKTTSEMIADLPKGMVEQMKAGNPFAQLMTA